MSALLLGGPAGADDAWSDPQGGQGVRTLHRSVRSFDFEQTEDTRSAFPDDFVRAIDPDAGFAPFGRMLTTSATAASGKRSFEFELQGGSMAARSKPGVIPVLPLADYAVTAEVRTVGLKNARACVVAWFNDTSGKPIPGSRRASVPVRTDGAWQTVRVELEGVFESATDLVVELQLLQPGQWADRDGRNGDVRIEDVTGRAWFDDVRISHLPRIELTTDSPTNIITLPDRPTFQLTVRDLTSEPLTARLRIYDIDGRLVHDRSVPAPRGRNDLLLNVPLDTCGWYRAVVDIDGRTSRAGRRWIDFAVVPPVKRWSAGNDFGVVLPTLELDRLAPVPMLVQDLGVGSALVPVWNRSINSKNARDVYAAYRGMIERLLARDVRLTFALDEIPGELASNLGLEPSQVFELLRHDPQQWRPYLDDLLVTFGLEVRRWQVGATGSTWRANDRKAVEIARLSLADFVAEPMIFVPCAPEQLADADLPSARHVMLPESCGAGALNAADAPWTAAPETETLVTLEPLDGAVYSPRQQVVDLMIRALEAWRNGHGRLAIPAPWRWSTDRSPTVMPSVLYPVWRLMTEQLAGRRFVTELKLEPGTNCWLVEGRQPEDALLIAWRDDLSSGSSGMLESLLGAGPVEVIDAFGNVTSVEPRGGLHSIALGETPVYIRNVNLPLVRFRGGFAIEPSFIPALNKVHEHEIVLSNPWDVAISGTVRIVDAPDLQITPRSQSFTIHPRSTARLPINIVFDRNTVAGMKDVAAEITLIADGEFHLDLRTQLQLGLDYIRFAVSWSTARNPDTGRDDLVVNVAVTNVGDEPVNLDAVLQAAGVSQNRRRMPPLAPGETALRKFSIVDGATLLAGKQVRIGVLERDGVARLNQIITIPEQTGDTTAIVNVEP